MASILTLLACLRAIVLLHTGFVRFDVRGDKMFARFIVAATGEVGDEVTLRAQVSADDACGEGYRAAEAASA